MRLLCIGLAVLTAAGCAEPPPPAEWVEAADHRWIELRPEGRGAGFSPVSGTGIDFTGTLSDSAFLGNRHLVNGAGVAIGDVDGDGLPDVFLAGLEASSRLYRNRGNMQFEDATEAAGLALEAWQNTGAAFLDTDGDADLDLVVTVLDGPSMLLLNDGTGRFQEDGSWPGKLAGPRGGTTLAAADIDGDTDLDVYVTNYRRHTVKDLYHPDEITFEETVVREGDAFRMLPPFDEYYRIEVQKRRVMRYQYGEPDMLLVNEGGSFRDATTTAFPTGTDLPEDWGLAAQFRDLDLDGDPDLYVCNDFEGPDHIWINRGDGTFRALPQLSLRHTPQSSMAIDGADVDRDGDIDLFVTEMLSRTHERRLRQVPGPPPIIPEPGEIQVRPQVMHNSLFLAQPAVRAGQPQIGVQDYVDAAWAFDVAASEWSWAAIFLDVDLDGWEDLLISTGHRYDAMDLDTQTSMAGRRSGDDWTAELLEFPRLDLNNVAFRNEGGTHFTEVAEGWGFGLEPDVTHGVAFGDLDGDGDLDLVGNRLQNTAVVWRNEADAPRIAVRLRGRGGNRFGIGARVTLEGGGMMQQKEILAGGQYLSGSEPIATFAALSGTMVLTVHWPSGARTTLPVQPNRLYEVDEPSGSSEPAPPPGPAALFSAEQLADHQDAHFEDRARQALLTRRLSNDGPYAASGDLDGDGRAEVVIGTGGGGRPVVYLNRADGLVPADVSVVRPAAGDWAGLAVSTGRLIAAVSGYETDLPSRLDQYSLNGERLVDRGSINLGGGSPGPLAVADVDGDGDDDLFVGMRFLPNRYPSSVPSRFYMREGDALMPGPELPAGLVTGAAFADADGDGDQDLAISTEWGPVLLYLNDGNGGFSDATDSWGLGDHTGLWRSATWLDADGDALPDLLTTNWGWNSTYGRIGAPDYEGRGRRLYFGDFDRNGSVDPVETEYVESLDAWAPIHRLMDLVRGLRYVTRRMETASEYANASISDVLGPAAGDAPFASINQLGHVLWLNRGDRFEPILLPEAAQRAPASDAAVLDVNGDAHPDVVLSQNFFPLLPEDGLRQDGGNGLVLIGDGAGNLQATGDALGLFGDGRAILAVDLEADGISELVATQNSAPAYLFRLNR
ncbi:MAG: VCBS repeat-containing protein [Rhodothermales bacterium]|nr:VCBS repeat-containing protein [Rhodothermales bacterium]MBO6779633.1 VCBS repeat-containing protein [Rhodothermales bacterium]